jgi:[glutamine synthetase] adenylyltransferase / [glutamine synthetase]-adenylyl-L-tyrosine phosphorylase
MALARARPVYGSPQIGKQARQRSFPKSCKQPRDPGKLIADAVKMREEIARHKPPSGPLDVKLGEGGLVDLEFAVHVLQLINKKGLHPRLESAVSSWSKQD